MSFASKHDRNDAAARNAHRTPADRKASRAEGRARLKAYYATPEAREAQERINKAHAEWIAAGMPGT